MNQRHPFHLVDKSPYPILMSMTLFQFVVHLTTILHGYNTNNHLLSFFLAIGCLLYNWFRCVDIEATFLMHHTVEVKYSLRLGFVLFIVSEVMLFFSGFWAYFHSALAPTVQIGCVWPPYGLQVLDPFATPLCNTVLLLTSGATITLAHMHLLFSVKSPFVGYYLTHSEISCAPLDESVKVYHNLITKIQQTPENDENIAQISSEYTKYHFYMKNPSYRRREIANLWIFITILLAILFTIFQIDEYIHAPFAINDSVYGAVFYFLTGLHGLHVIVGTVFLIVALIRGKLQRWSFKDKYCHFSFEAAAWYWHFVDVVWLYLYLCVYIQV